MSPEIPHSENQSSTQLPNQPSNQPDRLSPNPPENDRTNNPESNPGNDRTNAPESNPGNDRTNDPGNDRTNNPGTDPGNDRPADVTDVTDLYVSWDDYHRLIERLALQLYQSDWTFNQIVCLAKGGLRVGDTLARMFDCPLAILAVSSYGGLDNRQRGSITFSRDLTMTTPNLGSHILVVDDLVDSGITLERSLIWLDRHYGFYIQEMRTAVLWQKSTSVYQPHYAVEHLTQSPWIHQPFEPYEGMTPERWQHLQQNIHSEPCSGQSVL